MPKTTMLIFLSIRSPPCFTESLGERKQHLIPIIPFALHNLLLLGKYYCVHFTDGETEALKSSYLSEITLLGSCRGRNLYSGLFIFIAPPNSYSQSNVPHPTPHAHPVIQCRNPYCSLHIQWPSSFCSNTWMERGSHPSEAAPVPPFLPLLSCHSTGESQESFHPQKQDIKKEALELVFQKN